MQTVLRKVIQFAICFLGVAALFPVINDDTIEKTIWVYVFFIMFGAGLLNVFTGKGNDKSKGKAKKKSTKSAPRKKASSTPVSTAQHKPNLDYQTKTVDYFIFKNNQWTRIDSGDNNIDSIGLRLDSLKRRYPNDQINVRVRGTNTVVAVR